MTSEPKLPRLSCGASLGEELQARLGELHAAMGGARMYERTRTTLERWWRSRATSGTIQVGAFAATTNNSVIGVTVSLPLTPPREMKPGWVQVRGARRWNTNVETLVGARQNLLRSGVALLPAAPYSLETTFFDGARLNEAALLPLLPEGRQAFERHFAADDSAR